MHIHDCNILVHESASVYMNYQDTGLWSTRPGADQKWEMASVWFDRDVVDYRGETPLCEGMSAGRGGGERPGGVRGRREKGVLDEEKRTG